jgi:hypothetical protein
MNMPGVYEYGEGKRFMSKKINRRPKKRRTNEEFTSDLDQDEYFYYIAGYTSGGAPYGITWEEARAEGLIEEGENKDGDF